MRIKTFFSTLAFLATLCFSLLTVNTAWAEASAASHAISVETGKININTADAQTMASTMKGIGLKKAQAIVEYRNAYGPFPNIQDLSQVSGIGEKTVAKNASLLTVN